MNDSSKIRLLYTIVVILVLTNIAVIGFIMTRHPHGGPRDGRGPAGLVIKELKFDDAQQKQFEKLRDEHHALMIQIGERDRDLHNALFNSLSATNNKIKTSDSLIEEIAIGQKAKDQYTYQHLLLVRQMCKPEQQKIFDGMIAKAMSQARNQEGPPPPREN